jgi:hypothetical protein
MPPKAATKAARSFCEGSGPGGGGGAGAQLGTQWTTVSSHFLVQVAAEFGNTRRRYVATIRRGGQTPRDFQTLIFRRE